MTPRIASLAALSGAIALAAGAAGVASAATTGATRLAACNLSGSWVADTAETNAYFHRLNSSATRIDATSGSLTATFDHGTFTFGGIGIHLVAQIRTTKIKEEVDIEATSPYRVRGTSISLAAGTYDLTYVQASITVRGKTKPMRLPNQHVDTPGGSFGYSCTPSRLQLRVPAGAAGTVPLTMRRDRG